MATSIEPIEQLVSEAFAGFCKVHGLTPLAEAVDRHGSIEWLSVANGDLQRFISLSFTDVLKPSERYVSMEVWITVTRGARFYRKLIVKAQLSSNLNQDVPKVRALLPAALGEALSLAKGIFEDQLKASPSLVTTPEPPAI